MAKTEGQGITPPRFSITFLLLQLAFYSLTVNGKADFSVSGPGQPVLAVVGESVELQCSLLPNISAEHMEVRWYREQQSPAVHLLKEGREVPQEQMTQYRNRTAFLTAGLAQGHASLTIHNVTVFDNGTFHCMFKDGTVSANTTLWLTVAGLGSEPSIQVHTGQGEAIEAQCTSQGWYPEPQLEWRDFRGQALPSRTNHSVSPATGLFVVVSNVTVQDRAVRGLSCSISSPLIQETREARRHLPVTGFAQLSRSSPSMAWRTVLPVILTV
uniref:Ig-like domain-containing protein n=2 Tax=Suricata suricatta TaxID=37032 RepID=A0A673TKB2_SURSU